MIIFLFLFSILPFMLNIFIMHIYIQCYRLNTRFRSCTHPCPLSKSKFNTASTLLHRLVLLSVCFINPIYVRYSTNWDRKGWPGSEIKMYYCYPWLTVFFLTILILCGLNNSFRSHRFYHQKTIIWTADWKGRSSLKYYILCVALYVWKGIFNT